MDKVYTIYSYHMDGYNMLGLYNNLETAELAYDDIIKNTLKIPNYKNNLNIHYILYSYDFNKKSRDIFINYDNGYCCDFYDNTYLTDYMVKIKNTIFGDKEKFPTTDENIVYY